MNPNKAALSLVIITALYVSGLFWVDSKKDIFNQLSLLLSSLPVLLSLTSLSLLIRFGRWHWLLRKVGHKIPIKYGIASYLAGFAFTATPGKVGELLRIRYLEPVGILPKTVVSAFIFERLIDLISVLSLSMFGAFQFGVFWIAFFFTSFIIGAIVFLIRFPKIVDVIANRFNHLGYTRIEKLLETISNGIQGIKFWMTPLDIILSLISGLLSWLCLSFSFILLLNEFHVLIPFHTAISIYPISTLAGAASMIPGGLGSTEATIVTLLIKNNLEISIATIIAIGIRFSTIWFAVVIGILMLIPLEIKLQKNK